LIAGPPWLLFVTICFYAWKRANSVSTATKSISVTK